MTLKVLPFTTYPRWGRPGEEESSGEKVQTLFYFLFLPGKFQMPLAQASGCVGESRGVTRLRQGEFEHFMDKQPLTPCRGSRSPMHGVRGLGVECG